MAISTTQEKHEKLIKLLSNFGPHRKQFLLKEVAELCGTLNYLAYCSNWSLFSYIRIQESLISACVSLYERLRSHPTYEHLFQQNDPSAPGFIHNIPYLLKEKATIIWRSRSKISISAGARAQIKDILVVLHHPEKYDWSRPIGSIIPRFATGLRQGTHPCTPGEAGAHSTPSGSTSPGPTKFGVSPSFISIILKYPSTTWSSRSQSSSSQVHVLLGPRTLPPRDSHNPASNI